MSSFDGDATFVDANGRSENQTVGSSRYAHAVMLVVGVGTLLSSMATSSVTLALPELGREMGISVESSRWVLQSFFFAIAIAVLAVGRLSDSFGCMRIYQAGFLLFGLASLGCGLVDEFEILVAFRALQGVGTAMLAACAPALLTTSQPPHKRGRALGLMATCTYLGLTLGPPLGGLVVEWWDWRWIFWMNVPISFLVFVMSVFWFGPLLDEGNAAKLPWLDLSLFRSRVFSLATASSLANYIALFTMVLLLPFYLEEGLGYKTATAGKILMTHPLVMALVTSPAGWLSDKIGSRGLAVLGMLILSLGLYGLAELGSDGSLPGVVFWLALVGLGTGIFISPNSSALMGAAPGNKQGTAGSIMTEARVVGMLIGVTIAAAIFHDAGGQTGAPWSGMDFDALNVSIRVGAGFALLGAFLAFGQTRKV
jgi:MFS family permease